MSPRRSRVLRAADDGDPGRGERGLALGGRARSRRVVGVRAGAAAGLDGVAEVHQQLAVLPGHHVGRAARRRTRPSAKAAATARVVASVPPGKRPTSRIPGTGAAVLLDHPGLEVAGRHHHADALHVVEEPQQRRLVGHAVLHRHDRGRGPSTPVRSSTAACVWWLLTASSTVTGPSPDRPSARPRRRVRAIVRVPAGEARVSPSRRRAARCGAARHQHDVVARLVEQPAEHSADGPGAVHDPSHRLSLRPSTKVDNHGCVNVG